MQKYSKEFEKWYNAKNLGSFIASKNPKKIEIIKHIKELTLFISDASLREKLYCILNNIEARPTCHNINCQNTVKYEHRNFKGYKKYCIIHSRNDLDTKSISLKGSATNKKIKVYNTETFIHESKKIFKDIFTYAFTKYTTSHKKVIITCNIHGNFSVRADNHIHSKHGCPYCSKSKSYSFMCIEWLNSFDNHIQHAKNGGEYKIPETIINNDNRTGYKVDGFCKETNTVYEFLGDIWHGNIKLYEKNEIVHPYNKAPVKECYENTMNRLEKIKSLGYNVEYIWENDYVNQIQC